MTGVRVLRTEGEVKEAEARARSDYARRWVARFGFRCPEELLLQWYDDTQERESLDLEFSRLEMALLESRYNEGLVRSEFIHSIRNLAQRWAERDGEAVAECRNELLSLIEEAV